MPEEGHPPDPDEARADPDDPARVAALEARIADLERSNADLERFAAVAAHDLQAPLRVIAGFVELLRRGYAARLDSQADELITRTVAAVERMQRLTDDLLLHARVAAGTAGPPPQAVDTAEVVDEVLDTLDPLIAEAGVTVEVHDLPAVCGHRSLLVQLFQNLLTNAVKFAGDGPPRIRIEAARDGDAWRFAVRDNGTGIDPAARERVFEPFERGVVAGERVPGNGLGLAVCRQIVDRHGGRIGADAAAGGGTVITFTLPALTGEA